MHKWSNFKKTPTQMSGGKDGQTLFHSILTATTRILASKTAVNWHLKVKDIEYNVGLTKSYCITASMQKINLCTKWPRPVLTTFTQKSFKLLLVFLNLHQHAKNQFIPSIHSWDTANFRVPWPDWPHSFLTTPTQKIFDDQLLIYVNLYQHAKNQAISLICSGNMVD